MVSFLLLIIDLVKVYLIIQNHIYFVLFCYDHSLEYRFIITDISWYEYYLLYYFVIPLFTCFNKSQNTNRCRCLWQWWCLLWWYGCCLRGGNSSSSSSSSSSRFRFTLHAVVLFGSIRRGSGGGVVGTSICFLSWILIFTATCSSVKHFIQIVCLAEYPKTTLSLRSIKIVSPQPVHLYYLARSIVTGGIYS